MKIVIAGSRGYDNYGEAEEYIDLCRETLRSEEVTIISGGCTGADMLGERYASVRGLKIERLEARWAQYGKAAGPIRNKIMAEICDVAICFWDGNSKGTMSMIRCAQKAGKTVFVKHIVLL